MLLPDNACDQPAEHVLRVMRSHTRKEIETLRERMVTYTPTAPNLAISYATDQAKLEVLMTFERALSTELSKHEAQ